MKQLLSNGPSKPELMRWGRFVFWGGLNTIVSYLVYCGFVFLGAHIFLASMISLIAGILLGHFLNKKNVFRSENRNTLPKYFILWGALYLVHIGVLSLLTRQGMNDYLAGAVAGGLLVPVSYFFMKRLIFK